MAFEKLNMDLMELSDRSNLVRFPNPKLGGDPVQSNLDRFPAWVRDPV